MLDSAFCLSEFTDAIGTTIATIHIDVSTSNNVRILLWFVNVFLWVFFPNIINIEAYLCSVETYLTMTRNTFSNIFDVMKTLNTIQSLPFFISFHSIAIYF